MTFQLTKIKTYVKCNHRISSQLTITYQGRISTKRLAKILITILDE